VFRHPASEAGHATPFPAQLKLPPKLTRPANRLLAALPEDDYERLSRLLEVHPLRMRETLQEAGDSSEYVYFPTSGIISLLTVLESGMMIEFATVGREGTTGVPLFLGVSDSNMAVISQVPGEALRISAEDFLAEVARNSAFALLLTRYSGLMLVLVAQSAACNRAHHVDARCARWLLMTHDQAGGDSFPITQEFLAQMLGVSRPSVALSAAALQRAGMISYHRGKMTILNRKAMEKAACECYAVVNERFRRFQA
jgi:CRP-like cAMP-binding protein